MAISASTAASSSARFGSNGLSGVTNLLVQIVARNAEDLYRIAGQILDIDGVEKTTTGPVMRRLVDYRLEPLLASAEITSPGK